MKDIMTQFKAIAPAIVEAVSARVAPGMDDAAVMAIIHQEIAAYFEAQNNMAAQVLTFGPQQRAAFCDVMYDLLKPIADAMPPSVNPLYQSYVDRTGNTGALNYITQR